MWTSKIILQVYYVENFLMSMCQKNVLPNISHPHVVPVAVLLLCVEYAGFGSNLYVT